MIRISRWTVALSILLLTVFSGCRSMTPPVTFYTLSPIAESTLETKAITPRSPIIGIEPVDLPKTIDRTQMVTRSGPHQLAVSSLNRWAAFPNQLVQQVIGEDFEQTKTDILSQRTS